LVASRIVRFAAATQKQTLIGEKLDKAAIADAIAALPLEPVTMDSRLASAAYRKRLIPTLVRRAIASAILRGVTS
jgi:CO/xanthine dehydrogenase FAD-binding subunit